MLCRAAWWLVVLLRTAADSDDQGRPVTGLAVVDIVTGKEHVFELRSRDVPLAVELVDSFCDRMHPESRTGCKQALKEHLLETGHWQLQAPRLSLGPEVTISTSQGQAWNSWLRDIKLCEDESRSCHLLSTAGDCERPGSFDGWLDCMYILVFLDHSLHSW